MGDPQTQPKRQRGETIEAIVVEEEEEEEASKRQKYSYNHLLSILEEEEQEQEKEDESIQDLSAIFTALQQELCSPSPSHSPPPYSSSFGPPTCNTVQEVEPGPVIGPVNTTKISKEDENGDRVSVIRHLLEASDDELGIPSGGGMDGGDGEGNGINGADLQGFSLSDGLWELEDETANYYSLIHSELFM